MDNLKKLNEFVKIDKVTLLKSDENESRFRVSGIRGFACYAGLFNNLRKYQNYRIEFSAEVIFKDKNISIIHELDRGGWETITMTKDIQNQIENSQEYKNYLLVKGILTE